MRNKEIIEVKTNNPAKRFVFISDLHFDCISKNSPREKGHGHFNDDDAFMEREDIFIRFVKDNFANDILILAGDYYANYNQTLSFVKKLEASKITSYFVLGNHDYLSNNRTEFKDIISLFDSETNSHEYCKFLMTGKKYYHEDICIIGDTGWHQTSINKRLRKGSFSNLHFKAKLFTREGNRWLKYANDVLTNENKVLIVTHFPQAVIKDIGWVDWGTAKLLLQPENCWKIFGHTHQRGHFQFYNNICSQDGYRYKSTIDATSHMRYSKDDFGILEKAVASTYVSSFDVVSAFNTLAPFFTAELIKDPHNERASVQNIAKRGFKRAGNADNKRVIAEIIYDKAGYISRVREHLKAFEFSGYIGYVLNKQISPRTIEAVHTSLDILEHVSPNNARPFMTAVAVTGYVYSGMISHLERMRPVDDYDIMRWWLLFTTIQKFDLDPDEIKSVRKNDKECLHFHNVSLHLPKVNGKSLKATEVRALSLNTATADTVLEIEFENAGVKKISSNFVGSAGM